MNKAVDLPTLITRLQSNGRAISHLLKGVTAEQASFQPDADSWSVLQVACHLYDEEREDFRVRLQHTLEQRSGLPPDIAPERWVTERSYAEQNLNEVRQKLKAERGSSLAWLRTLKNPDWNAKIVMPNFTITAGDFLYSWVAHDFLHIRQLNELHYTYNRKQAEPFTVIYAGPWD